MAEIEGVVPNLQAWAKIEAAVRAHESSQLPPQQRRTLPDRDFVRVKFRNNSGETVPAYGCMRVTGVELDEGVLRFVVAKPDTSFNRLYLVNSGSSVASGAPGWGTWLYHADKVLYESGTPAFGESWGPKASQWSLAKWRYGFTIQGQNDTTALTTYAIQSEVNGFLCKSNEEFAADGDTGAVSVYDGNQADITGTDVSGCINRTGIVWESGKWGKATWLGGNWYVEPWECPAA